ncbi:MAG TPA: hypothetical protein VFV38_35125 [Ktedonobacteraceae bacterium]|nr:hypothetical protein [Ktedonobacteraceae bacterium]
MKANAQKRVVRYKASHFGQWQKARVVIDFEQSLPNRLSSVKPNHKQTKRSPGSARVTRASFSTKDITEVALFLIPDL